MISRWTVFRQSVHVYILCAVGIGAVSLAHVFPKVGALNYFDPPKRLIWSAMALLLAGLLFRERSDGREGVRLSLLGCLGWIALRSLVRHHPGSEIEGLMAWLLPGVLFGVGLAVDHDRAIRVLAWALVLFGGAEALCMVLQYFGRDPFFAETTSALAYRPGRMIGTVGYQNQAADFLAVCCAGLFILVRSGGLRLLVFCGVLGVIGLTGNRGATLGLIGAVLAAEVATAAYAKLDRQQVVRRLAMPLGGFAVALSCIFVVAPTTRERFAEVMTEPNQDPAFKSRVTMMRIAADLWGERPLVGWGAGAFALQYLDRLGKVLPVEKTPETLKNVVFAREAHNDYLQYAAEFGLIGIALLLCLLAFVASTLWLGKSTQQPAAAGCVFVLAYMTIAGLVSFPWQTALGGPLAGLVLGIMLPRRTVPGMPTGGLMARMTTLAERPVYVVLAVVLLAWNAADAWMNVRLPAAIGSGGAARMAKRIPDCMHKYHAVVGAALAQEGACADALHELCRAYAGYRDPLLYNNLGYVLSKLQQWCDAVQVYQAWAKTGIDHTTALADLAIAYEHVGDFGLAATTLDRRAGLCGGHDLSSVERAATLHLRSGQSESALHILRQYEADHSGDRCSAEFDNIFGAALLMAGDRTAAAGRFKSALRKNPELRSARLNLDRFEPAEQRP